MNVRGGNGYVEEWVNPRLLRDAYLGAIWEGATNVVALDVQRAIRRDGCLAALGDLVHARLETVTDRLAKPAGDGVRDALDEVTRRAAAWPGLGTAERELEARPVADTLYHVVASTLLLAEGQTLRDRCGDHRKLLMAALYQQRWLRPTHPAAPVFSARALAWLPALVDWTPIPADALAGETSGAA